MVVSWNRTGGFPKPINLIGTNTDQYFSHTEEMR
jgi:hypothetical protein